MTSMESNEVEIRYADHLQPPPVAASYGVLANLYRSANYVVVDVGLPRCHAHSVRVSIAADAVLIEAARHVAEDSADDGREYLLHELPHGAIARLIRLPVVDLALGRAEAHLGNGMLVLSIPVAS